MAKAVKATKAAATGVTSRVVGSWISTIAGVALAGLNIYANSVNTAGMKPSVAAVSAGIAILGALAHDGQTAAK